MGASNAIWNSQGSEKREAVREMFGRIAPQYDRINGLLSLRFHNRWRAFAASKLNLKPGDSAADLCCGTGDFIPHLRRSVGAKGRVLGIDFCLPMLEIAAQKQAPANLLVLADAAAIPVRDAVLDGVSVGWGIRNVSDIDLAHREIARVLVKGGRFVSLDMAVPKNPLLRKLSAVFCGGIVPAIGKIFGHEEAYVYLPKSTAQFWTREMLLESMKRAGFVDCGWKDLMLGNICVHWGTKA